MQLRHETPLTSEAYLAEHAWAKASLALCPRHPHGGCGFERHGTYPRKTPAGMRVTRYYCPTAHETFSLLPDCLASRFPSDLDDLEQVVREVGGAERGSGGRSAAARDRAAVGRALDSALAVVRAALGIVAGLLPDLHVGEASLVVLARLWGTDRVLVSARSRVAAHLPILPPPLGFGPRPIRRPTHRTRRQHAMGPDAVGPSG